jgi:hypothetical protein
MHNRAGAVMPIQQDELRLRRQRKWFELKGEGAGSIDADGHLDRNRLIAMRKLALERLGLGEGNCRHVTCPCWEALRALAHAVSTETFRQLPEGGGALEQAMRFKKTQAPTDDLLDELEADRGIGGNLGIEG